MTFNFASDMAIIDLQVPTDRPTQLLHPLYEGCHARE
jgi:hypothetical protein